MAGPFLQRVSRERIEMTAGGELVHDDARLLKESVQVMTMSSLHLRKRRVNLSRTAQKLLRPIKSKPVSATATLRAQPTPRTLRHHKPNIAGGHFPHARSCVEKPVEHGKAARLSLPRLRRSVILG
jgi:hypothetical protein